MHIDLLDSDTDFKQASIPTQVDLTVSDNDHVDQKELAEKRKVKVFKDE